MREQITYTDARNPKWVNAAHTAIELEVNFDHISDEEYSPCGIRDLNGKEGEEHIADLWNRALAGDFGEIVEFETPADYDAEETMLRFHIRPNRDALLQQSDAMVANDKWENYTAEEKKAWTEYRQALRDVPQNWTHTASYHTEDDTWRVNGDFAFPTPPNAS